KDRPRAVISQRVAEILWPGQNPLGKHIRGAATPRLSLEVVGVVADVRAAAEQEPTPIVYEHYWRMQPVGMSFTIRTASHPAPVERAIRGVLSAADPDMAISSPRTMEQIFDDSVADRRYETYLASAFAMAAVLLAALGVFSVISFNVAR